MADKTSFDKREIVASGTECTGILPAMDAENPDQAQENAARLYAIHAPEKKHRRKENEQHSNAPHQRKTR